MNDMLSLEDRCRGSLLGLAAGDALGSQVTFASPGSFPLVTEMTGGGRLRLAPGYWTDDTAMALCLAESLIDCKGFNPTDQMNRYVRWLQTGSNSSIGRSFGIGKTVLARLTDYMRTGEPLSGSRHHRSAGNGSLMRLAPVPLYYHRNIEEAVSFAGLSSQTTHALPVCIDACRYLSALIWGALHGTTKDKLLSPLFTPEEGLWKKSPLCPEIRMIAQGSFKYKKPPVLRANGYVVHTLEAALWAFNQAKTFKEGLLLAVNLGEDADTTGAVYGQLAGAFFGLQAIPEHWIALLHKSKKIDTIAQTLARNQPEKVGGASTTAP